jgi:hypothetical protein
VTGAASSSPRSGRGIGRALLVYAGASAAVIALAAGVFMLVYDDASARQAVWTSAAVAFPVQLVAFAIARLMAQVNHGIAGWGLGALVCLLTLVLYGVIVRGTTLPEGAALVSLATFLFITELIEPPLLNV